MPIDEPLIDVIGLGKIYAGRLTVRGVTLRVERGDMIGLVGANGGGKTTTLRMLAGLMRPDIGTGRVLGADIGDATTQRRSLTGYMPQQLSLHAALTVRENLRFRAEVHGMPAPKNAIAEASARWGLDAVLDQRVAHLSGGWGRRAQFAATMLHAPPLLLLDEPTAGLDVVTKNAIWCWLAELAALGHGIVISTHDLAEAEKCPSILYYQDGKVRGPIPPAGLIASSSTDTLEGAVLALATDDG
jgi:ABC-type multidrug transport system ATPase subunit